MATIVTRAGKGSPLTNAEVDANFNNLNSDKVETSIGVVTTGSYADPAWITSLAETKVLPSQTSQSGKYLTTNGTATSWADVTAATNLAGGEANQVPYQTGAGATAFTSAPTSAGTALTWNGSAFVWASGSGASLSDDTSTNATRYVTFSDATSGVFGTAYVSSTKLTFNPSTGNLNVGGNVTANSDERLKTDIQTISGALAKIEAIRGTSFIMNGCRQVGVVAQEVQPVIPEVVIKNVDGYLSVAYGNITAVLIEAVKELSAEVKTLKARLGDA